MPKNCKTVLAACSTSWSALTGVCKGTVHARHCHWLATSATFIAKNSGGACGTSKRRWAPLATRATASPLPPLKPTKVTFFTMILDNSENSIRDIRPSCSQLFCHSSFVKFPYLSCSRQQWTRNETWPPNITEIVPLTLLAGSAPALVTIGGGTGEAAWA